MTTITHTADGPRFDGMTVGELIASLDREATILEAANEEGVPYIRSIIAALRYLSEWQPIETAPRDGTEIDLWKGKHRFPNCHFHCGEWLWWNTTSVDDEPSWLTVEGPTHWRPLPPGPDGGGA